MRQEPPFEANNFSDVALYNIGAVVEATGIPAITLRSWERRYGLPSPQRDESGNRVFSERDIATANWLKEAIGRGISIGRATSVLGHLVEEKDWPPTTVDSPTSAAPLHSLLAAIEQLDEAAAKSVISHALNVFTVEYVCLSLLQPLLYAIGDRWANGEMSVVTEHFASNLVHSQLHRLLAASPPPVHPGKLLVGCGPGEEHVVGTLMVTLLLRRRGFDAVFLGANVEPVGLLSEVKRLKPAAVCLSASTSESAAEIIRLFERAGGEYEGLLGFGGRAFNESPDLIASCPGTYFGSDAVTAVRSLEDLLGPERRTTPDNDL